MADLITYRDAVAVGIAREMRRDPTVVCLGEDIGAAEGVFKTTVGLFAEFGAERVWDTPISEQAIVGAAMGAAMTGLRPIAELMFSDFFAVTWDMVANQIAKTRYMTDGQVSVPLVLRTANGAGLRFGAQHSQSIENWAMAIPGLKVVAPSTPADVVGLMAAAVRDPDPVIFCERHLDGGDRPADPRPDRRAGDPCLRREDEPAIHGRGEPPAMWLGRGDRLDRRRRWLLQPRRPSRPDHDAARPAAVGGRPRGRCHPDRRTDHRHRPAPAG